MISNPGIAILYFSLLGSIKYEGKYLFLFICLDYLEVQEAKSIQHVKMSASSILSTWYCQEHLPFDFPNDSSLRIIIIIMHIMFHGLTINPLLP